MHPKALYDLSKFDPSDVVADTEAIRALNPQRHEMEQLSHICHFDLEAGEAAGVLNIPEKPWWARGHVPGRPLMPGVLMLEAAAQLSSWCVHQVYDASDYKGRIFGFAGLENVKFRNVIFPPNRVIVVGKRVQVRPRRAIFDTQGFVNGFETLVWEARIKGMWV